MTRLFLLAPLLTVFVSCLTRLSGLSDASASVDDWCSQSLPQELKSSLSSSASLLSSCSPSFSSHLSTWTLDTRSSSSLARIPGLIVVASMPSDIESAIKYARKHGIEVAVKSGGMGFGARSMTSGGVLVDVSSMKTCRYDQRTETVTMAAGLTVQETTECMKATGLLRSPATGLCPGVGVNFMNGGWGALSRRVGLAVDNLVSVTITDAEGVTSILNDTSVSLTPTQDDDDLWWAVRGASSNFGIVSSVTYKTHDVSNFKYALLFYPSASSFAAVTIWISEHASDRRLGSIALIQDGHLLLFLWAWDTRPAGDGDLIEEWLSSTNNLFGGIVNARGDGYFQFQDFYYSITRGFPIHAYSWSRGGGYNFSGSGTGVSAVDGEFIAAFLNSSASSSSSSIALLELWGGAIADIHTQTETAFWARQAQFTFMLSDWWYDGKENEARIQALNQRVEPLYQHKGSTRDAYLNYLTATPENVRVGYGGNLARLATIKRKKDPDNFFHLNYNINVTEIELAASISVHAEKIEL